MNLLNSRVKFRQKLAESSVRNLLILWDYIRLRIRELTGRIYRNNLISHSIEYKELPEDEISSKGRAILIKDA
jgi:hypothetical protein